MPHRRIPLGQLGEVFQGLALKPDESSGRTPYKFINIRDLEQLELRGNGLNSVHLDLPSKLEARHTLRPGDVLITTRTRPLRASVVTADLGPAIAGQNLGVLRLTTEASPLYIAALLTSSYGQALTGPLFSRSSTIPLISLTTLKDLEIPVPPLPEQHHLATIMQQFETLERLTQQSLDARRALMESAVKTVLDGVIRPALKG